MLEFDGGVYAIKMLIILINVTTSPPLTRVIRQRDLCLHALSARAIQPNPLLSLFGSSVPYLPCQTSHHL
jgi:hypothetical protein